MALVTVVLKCMSCEPAWAEPDEDFFVKFSCEQADLSITLKTVEGGEKKFLGVQEVCFEFVVNSIIDSLVIDYCNRKGGQDL